MKNKGILFVISLAFLCLFFSPAYSRIITSSEAALAASHQLARLGKQTGFALKEGREIMKEGLLLAYAFDLDPAGYIVVSASSALPPVIAYSTGSNFGDMGQGNPLFEILEADLSKRTKLSDIPGYYTVSQNERCWKEILSNGFIAAAHPLFEQWPPSGDGWLKTNWTQSAPYNNFCPMDPVTGLRSYAGCPATAMAQIMNFHETSNNTRFDDSDDYYHNYAGRQYWIDDDCDAVGFACFPVLNTCLDTLEAHYKAHAALTSDDKAALTFACAVACRSVFTSQGSGTFGVGQAYDAYIRFGCSTVELLDSNDADLYERLKQNIMDTLPAHLAIVDESWSTGHNVVVDGYNTDDYYHLNFGWGGSYNGWYLLPQEIPYELTVVEGLVVDIMKKIPTCIIFVDAIKAPVTFFPNPADEFLQFKSDEKLTNPVLTIYDLQGRKVSENEISSDNPLYVGNLKSGFYIYRLIANNSSQAGKIIIQ
jgi:hypothetical protein